MYPHFLHKERCLPDEVSRIPHQDKQLIEIILMKSELLGDITAELHQTENSRQPEEPKVLNNEAMDNRLIERHIDTAINEVVGRCQAYLLMPSPFVHRIANNHTSRWDEKSIMLGMPMSWPPHCIDALRDACHNYIVQRAQALFLAKTSPKDAELAEGFAINHYSEINALLSHRIGGVHIHPTWLG